MLKRIALIFLFSAGAVHAKPSLWSFERVDQGLFDVGVAWGVKENCSYISENKLRGIGFLLRLSNYAMEQGYSRAEVRAFVKDPVEKAKLRKRVTKYFQDQGLDPNVSDALCSFGDAAIKSQTQVGKLLSRN